MLPNTLTDRELVRFSEKHILTTGLPSDFQRELLHRFEDKLDIIEALQEELTK